VVYTLRGPADEAESDGKIVNPNHSSNYSGNWQEMSKSSRF
jgi:hypothetical protein